MIAETTGATATGTTGATGAQPALDPRTILDDLDAGRVRAAWPDRGAPGGWRIDTAVKAAILARFADLTTVDHDLDGVFQSRDRVGLPLKALLDGTLAEAAAAAGRPWRVVPGGTTIRAGVHLGLGVVVMPPSYVNVGAWIGDDAMVDSHVLVGSCAQIGARVHLAAGVQVGGVLEPPGARPVIVEDGAFIGAQCGLFEGVLVGAGAVIAAGTILTGTSRLYDLTTERILRGTTADPLAVPPGAVVIPGSRSLDGAFARAHGLTASTALIVKYRDAGTDARVALEEALR